MITKEEIQHHFEDLQDTICQSLELLDGVSHFKEEKWNRKEGGGGRTRIIENGDVIEKGGVNFSAVYGPTPSKILEALKLDKANFFATGVSIVLHPSNPWVPIIHMNIRYFEMSNGIWWFGGGIDLTPHIILDEQAQAFHLRLKATCDKHDPSYYHDFKKWADDYFFIPHRNETRGVGGIFFDRLNATEHHTKDQRFDFVLDVGKTFIPSYNEVAIANRAKSFSEEDREWLLIRRGRYVEFNLVYDKGTKFGLDTNGRTESILMSLPPDVKWAYSFEPQKDHHKHTLEMLRKDIDWSGL